MIENVSNFDDESWGPKAEKISIWHFDPTIVDKEEDVFMKVCNFDLDFDEDLKKAKENIQPTVTHHTEFWSGIGYPEGVPITDSSFKFDLSKYPNFKEIIDRLGLVEHKEFDIKVKLFCQRPGQMLPTHIDNYKKASEEKTSEIALTALRFVVALNDWDIGHYWHFGNAVWKQWKKGDCVHWHRTMAHGTANTGHSDRLSLQITGIPSEKTFKLIHS